MPATGARYRIDLNADLGEGIDDGSLDEALLAVVTSASVACGFHAGEPPLMHRVTEEAARRGVVVGAHPSYADREGFGRVEREVEPSRLTDEVLYQIGALDGVARRCGTRVRYVKPHGALYNRMALDTSCAEAVCEAVRAYGGLLLLAPAGSPSLEVAHGLGVGVVTEVFADRAYLPDGRIVPRGAAGAVVSDPDEAARRAVTLATANRVDTVDGSTLELHGSSICVHGDTPGALAIATKVRAALLEAGVALGPFVD